ncbi:MAG: hypothetical protein ACKVOJ_10530 [Sphingomonadaceae bacterium]
MAKLISSFLVALAALLSSSAALAADGVALTSAVFVERFIADNDGKTRVVLQEPKVVTPGDKMIFVLNYHNVGRASANNFVVTNPMPSAVAYEATNDPAAELSVDGGRTWGPLHALKTREGDGNWRAARAEDVTHVRWMMRTAIPAGAQGKLSFRGVVR